jgi:hypothetical protein
MNHLQLLKDIKDNNYDSIDLDSRTNVSILGKRYFTVNCIQAVESLSLSFTDIDKMKKDYQDSSVDFIKW